MLSVRDVVYILSRAPLPINHLDQVPPSFFNFLLKLVLLSTTKENKPLKEYSFFDNAPPKLFYKFTTILWNQISGKFIFQELPQIRFLEEICNIWMKINNCFLIKLIWINFINLKSKDIFRIFLLWKKGYSAQATSSNLYWSLLLFLKKKKIVKMTWTEIKIWKISHENEISRLDFYNGCKKRHI